MTAKIIPFFDYPRPARHPLKPGELPLVLVLPVVRIDGDGALAPRRRRTSKKATEDLRRVSIVDHPALDFDAYSTPIYPPSSDFLARVVEKTREKLLAEMQRMIAESFGLSVDDLKERR